MNRYIILLALALAVGPVHADLQPPPRSLQPVLDPSMVVLDRGAQLEVFPSKRAIPQADATGRMTVHEVISARSDSMIGPGHLGVVFNHSMQQQGYISGEITVKLKAAHSAAALKSLSYPGFKKITSPEVYVVNARTPAEFLKVLKSLQARTDLEWVEPTVGYGPAAGRPVTH